MLLLSACRYLLATAKISCRQTARFCTACHYRYPPRGYKTATDLSALSWCRRNFAQTHYQLVTGPTGQHFVIHAKQDSLFCHTVIRRCANLRLRAPSLTAERGEPRSTGGLGTGVGTTRRKTTPRRPAPQPPRGGRRLRGPPERKTATRYLSQTTQQVCGRLVRAWRDEHAWQRPPGLGAVCFSLRVAYSLARSNSLALRNAPYTSWAAR